MINDGITPTTRLGGKIPTLVCYMNMILFNAKVGIFPPTYAVIPSFIYCFTTFYCFDL